MRALLAFKRGEPHVCAMVPVPTPEEEDLRRISRERKVLTNKHVSHVNRIKGLLFTQGVSGYEPLHRDRRRRLEELKTGDGRQLPVQLKLQIGRELDRLELLLKQIKAIETERDAMLAAAPVDSAQFADCEQPGSRRRRAGPEDAVRALSVFEETLCGRRLSRTCLRQGSEEGHARTGDRDHRAIRHSLAKGFEVLPRRWVVERTFAWLGRCRWLVKDFENLSRNALAFLKLASIRLMLRRLCAK